MKKGNIEALQWFVDFANLDLETIRPGDKAKLLVEAEDYLWPPKEDRVFFELVYSPADRRKKMGPVAWAFDISPKESQEYWAAVLRSQKAVRKLFSEEIIQVTEPGVTWGEDTVMWWIVSGEKTPYSMRFFPITESQDNYLRLKIFRLLEGFPYHAIRKCPGCDKFFFNPTNRERRFCGNRCMWRISTAERREADKEGYNKYQAELMRDRYREEKGLPRKKTKARKGRAIGDRIHRDAPEKKEG